MFLFQLLYSLTLFFQLISNLFLLIVALRSTYQLTLINNFSMTTYKPILTGLFTYLLTNVFFLYLFATFFLFTLTFITSDIFFLYKIICLECK